jgi:hypothetical protein
MAVHQVKPYQMEGLLRRLTTGRGSCLLDGSHGCFQEWALARTGEALLQTMRANFVQFAGRNPMRCSECIKLLLCQIIIFVLFPKSSIRMSQAPVLDLSVRPRRTSRPGDHDVDLRPRPWILVRGKLRWRRWIYVQESRPLPAVLDVRFRNLGRVVRSIAVCRRCVASL